MDDFLILAAPLLVVAAAVIGLFIWGAKGNIEPKKQTPDRQ